MARERKSVPTVEVDVRPVVVDVKSLTNFAFAAGLTVDSAEQALLDAPDDACRVEIHPCPSARCGGETARILFAPAAFNGRSMIFCESCGEADIWL